MNREVNGSSSSRKVWKRPVRLHEPAWTCFGFVNKKGMGAWEYVLPGPTPAMTAGGTEDEVDIARVNFCILVGCESCRRIAVSRKAGSIGNCRWRPSGNERAMVMMYFSRSCGARSANAERSVSNHRSCQHRSARGRPAPQSKSRASRRRWEVLLIHGDRESDRETERKSMAKRD